MAAQQVFGNVTTMAPRIVQSVGAASLPQVGQPIVTTRMAAPAAQSTILSQPTIVSQPTVIRPATTTIAAPQAATVISGAPQTVTYAQPVTYAAPQPVTYVQPAVYTQPAQPVAAAPVEPEGNFKVCVVGGAGGIGQPLSLLMAQCPMVAELAIIDLNVAMVPAAGVEADLSHIEGKCKVTSTVLTLNEDKAIDKAGDALTGCHLVLVPAGVPRKPGQDRKDLLNINCDIAKGTVEACAKYCPDAVVALIVNPVNSVVPAMCELWKKAGLDPRKIVGVTTLDIVRANKFVQEITGSPASIPVIGGHAGKTILPLFSQDPAGASIPAEMIPELDERVQNAGTEVVKAKNGKGSATLSMAYSGARLGKAVLSGLAGVPTVECAYVESNLFEGLPYFSSLVEFGPNGIQAVMDVGQLSEHETARLQELCPILQDEINDGLEYAQTHEFGQ